MAHSILSYWEHCKDVTISGELGLTEVSYSSAFPQKKNVSLPCYHISKNRIGDYILNTGYFVGIDWVLKEQLALFVAPKLNKTNTNYDQNAWIEIDLTKMLFASLSNAVSSSEIENLYKIKWGEPHIAIEQKNDLLTPLLIFAFLGIVKEIVRKGLKKSYYSVEENLQSRLKGKVMVGTTIKKNLMSNKPSYTYCAYDEFGVDNKENRLLKKALVFIKRYMNTFKKLSQGVSIQDTFNYINPAFQLVSDKINLNDIKHTSYNAFYKEYGEALRLAKLILQRFGYNFSNTVKQEMQTPPFWIDMSKLFELYVLGLLRERFYNKVKYHFEFAGNELDYLLNNSVYQMVIDAKYKPKYVKSLDNNDMRQVSGYARLTEVYKAFGKEYPESIDALIIYPDQENGLVSLMGENLKINPIQHYEGCYKISVKLPTV